MPRALTTEQQRAIEEVQENLDEIKLYLDQWVAGGGSEWVLVERVDAVREQVWRALGYLD